MRSARSTDVWHSLPGTICAYQSIAAPDPFAARQNVAHQGARFGVYTAASATPPAWKVSSGWIFSGTPHQLNTMVVPQNGWSMLVRFSQVSGVLFAIAAGSQKSPGNYRFYLAPWHDSGTNTRTYGHGGAVSIAGRKSSGVMGVSGATGYLDGNYDGAVTTSWDGATTLSVILGANNTTGGVTSFLTGNISTFIIVSRVLSPAEMWLASRQIAYCEQNPDWNAWARRRMYYYAPPAAAAAFNPAWARNSNTVINQVHP